MIVDPDFDKHLADLIFQARMWWGIAGLSVLLLIGLALTLRSRPFASDITQKRWAFSLRRLRELHESESGIASMEFLMVFLPFLIIVMTVWQLAFMFNAQIHVGYSAYAAARSASVMIPAKLKDEPENAIKKLGSAGAEKWKSIRRAAIPGVLAISPGSAGDAAGVVATLRAKELVSGGGFNFGGAPDPAVVSRLTLLRAHYGLGNFFTGTREKRGFVKSLYADNVTQVLIDGKDQKTERNFDGVDTIAVTVKYAFWLNVPYVGRMIGALMGGAGERLAAEVGITNPYPSMELTETIHVKLWTRKRTIEPCNA
jgi:hypothetical protein